LIYVLKSRGMAHSNQVREFLITSRGIQLVEAYVGADGVLTGSARLSQQAREQAAKQVVQEEVERKRLALEHRRKAVHAQIEALKAGFSAEAEEFARVSSSDEARTKQIETDREAMGVSRKVTLRVK
jgi:circadian clock protein KaiC